MIPSIASMSPATRQEETREFLRAAKAANTRRAYTSDWRGFVAWCEYTDAACLPALEGTVAAYLTELAADHKASTIQRKVAAISQAHITAGYESPTRGPLVRNLVAGIRRSKGTAPQVKAPVMTEDLRAMVAAIPETRAGLRDRALLLVGFAGAFRRSELVALDLGDLEIRRDGVVITIRRSKTDQEGQGRKVGLPWGLASQALRRWIDAAPIVEGPVFRAVDARGCVSRYRLTDRSVARVVKKWAALTGLESTLYAGHSLRSGLATSAARAGASERAIMAQTGHKSVTTVRKYIRNDILGQENAATLAGV